MPDVTVNNEVVNVILKDDETFTVATGTTVKVTIQSSGSIAALDLPNAELAINIVSDNSDLPLKSSVVLDEGATIASDGFGTIITGFVIS